MKLTHEQVAELQSNTDFWFELASEIYNRKFISVRICCDIRGTTAGMACLNRRIIRYNPVLYLENRVKFLARTVPHEVAHFIVWDMYPFAKPHGIEWKSVMNKFGCEESRCHNYDTSNVINAGKKITYIYKCACKEWSFSSIRHRRSQFNGGYICKNCNTRCKFMN